MDLASRDALRRGLRWWGAGSPLKPLLPGYQSHSGGAHPWTSPPPKGPMALVQEGAFLHRRFSEPAGMTSGHWTALTPHSP